MEKPRLIFISGGARSGKSSFAEEYAATLAEKEKRKLYYLATAHRSDDEMIERIRRHQNERRNSGFKWETIESQTILASKMNLFSANSVVLLDCLTILVSNELFQNRFDEEKWKSQAIQSEVINSILEGIDVLVRCVKALIIVSNEVVYDPMPKDEQLIHTYCKILGLIHQHLVRKSVKAYTVEMGIPLLMKEDNRCME